MYSLEKDFANCLVHPYAPMPAILWCLTCIDLLGALLTEQASKKIPGTNENVKMTENSVGSFLISPHSFFVCPESIQP
jgi:hypothetical protein